jgi:hypothetical protein
MCTIENFLSPTSAAPWGLTGPNERKRTFRPLNELTEYCRAEAGIIDADAHGGRLTEQFPACPDVCLSDMDAMSWSIVAGRGRFGRDANILRLHGERNNLSEKGSVRDSGKFANSVHEVFPHSLISLEVTSVSLTVNF